MTADTQCLPFLPTILSLSITIFMGVIAFVIHLSSGQRPVKVVRPKGRHRSVQTDDLDAKTKKESANLAKQLKQQKIVSCNLEEENEALQEQVNALKRTVNERKAEVTALKEQLEEATTRCDQLSSSVKKLQATELEEKGEKKSDAEFQSAMAMLLDLAEQSVNREIRSVSGSAKKGQPHSALTLNPDDFAPEDWTFMMSVAGMSEERRKDLEDGDASKVISRQQFVVPPPQLLFNEPSPTIVEAEKGSRVFPTTAPIFPNDSVHCLSPPANSHPADSCKSSPAEARTPTSEENLSPDPAETKALGHKPLPLDGLELEELSTAHSWASLSNTPSFSDAEPVFNPNPKAKPFVPKRQQMQQEIQKRLQQWKDFYYTQVQPQEEAAAAQQKQQQQQPKGWAEGTPSSRYSQQEALRLPQAQQGWTYCTTQYYPPQLEWDQAQEEGYYDPYASQPPVWEQPPQTSEVMPEELWPSMASMPSDMGDLTSHQPYSMHCKCTSCLNEKSNTASSPHERTLSMEVEEGCMQSRVVYDCQGEEFDNATIGLAFRFPLLSKEGEEPCGTWRLAHEAFEPFYLARFTPLSGLACQIVITEEYLQPPHTLNSYVDLSKRQTERTLAAYHLVFQSERQLSIGDFEAFEVIYKQGTKGDMLVWSVCILAFERILTLQVVAANASKYNVLAALGPVLESLQVAFPQPLAEAYERQQTQACEAIQRTVRCWLARREVQTIRHEQHAEELEENDVFIRVTTRINPEFSR